jgi:hypothetical protein
MKIDKQVIFTAVVGIMMVTWAMGMALSYNIQTGPQGMKIESVYTEPLTGTEKVTILRTGRVLIEYLYLPGDPEALDRRALYENFVAQFGGFAVLNVVEVSAENETLNQMIAPDGDIIPLDNVTAASIVDVFCDNAFVQPRECLLRSI